MIRRWTFSPEETSTLDLAGGGCRHWFAYPLFENPYKKQEPKPDTAVVRAVEPTTMEWKGKSLSKSLSPNRLSREEKKRKEEQARKRRGGVGEEARVILV